MFSHFGVVSAPTKATVEWILTAGGWVRRGVSGFLDVPGLSEDQ